MRITWSQANIWIFEAHSISRASLYPELFLQSPTAALPMQAVSGSRASDKYSSLQSFTFSPSCPSLILIGKTNILNVMKNILNFKNFSIVKIFFDCQDFLFFFSLVTSQHSTSAPSILDWALAAVTMRRREKAEIRKKEEWPTVGADILHKNYFSNSLCWSSEQCLVLHESSLAARMLPN